MRRLRVFHNKVSFTVGRKANAKHQEGSNAITLPVHSNNPPDRMASGQSAATAVDNALMARAWLEAVGIRDAALPMAQRWDPRPTGISPSVATLQGMARFGAHGLENSYDHMTSRTRLPDLKYLGFKLTDTFGGKSRIVGGGRQTSIYNSQKRTFHPPLGSPKIFRR